MIDLTPHALAARARAWEHVAAAKELEREALRLKHQALQHRAIYLREIDAAKRLQAAGRRRSSWWR